MTKEKKLKPTYRLLGNLGILDAKLRPDIRDSFKKDLHLKSRPWRDNPPIHVRAYRTADDYFWIPRFFLDGAIETGKLGKKSIKFEWTDGDPQDLDLHITLEQARGQPVAVNKMEKHLRKHSGGILVAPTGCGKTILGYAIGHRFKTSIGVLVYNGHMLDNWISTAKLVFGLEDDEIGVVQSERCDLGKPVTIMMVQSLLSRAYPKELYDQIGFIVADEVNRYGAPQWNEVVRLFPARYRLGLSADPSRTDGLDALIEWHFGDVGHTITMAAAKPDVVQIHYNTNYNPVRYCSSVRKTKTGKVKYKDPNPVRYDKALESDKGRNKMIVEELVKARLTGRRILLFSRFRKHLNELKEAFDKAWTPNVLDSLADTDSASNRLAIPTKSTLLVGGLKASRLEEAMDGDVIFSTYSFARDALNLPTLDTLVFATPPGNPLQPVGRLRDKGSPDRRSLLVLDIFESGDYPTKKAKRRCDTYSSLGIKVTQVSRNKRPK